MTQNTQPSAMWTQGTVRSLPDRNTGGLQTSEDQDGEATVHMNTTIVVPHACGGRATVPADRNTTEELSGSTDDRVGPEDRDEDLALSGYHSAGLDERIQNYIEEKPSVDPNIPGANEEAAVHCAYMEDADEYGNPIEGTIVHAKHDRHQSGYAMIHGDFETKVSKAVMLRSPTAEVIPHPLNQLLLVSIALIGPHSLLTHPIRRVVSPSRCQNLQFWRLILR